MFGIALLFFISSNVWYWSYY